MYKPELCLRNLNSLAGVNLVHMDEDGFGLRPTGTTKTHWVAFRISKLLWDN